MVLFELSIVGCNTYDSSKGIEECSIAAYVAVEHPELILLGYDQDIKDIHSLIYAPTIQYTSHSICSIDFLTVTKSSFVAPLVPAITEPVSIP